MKTKSKKVNTIGLPPVKRFLYSHIARLRTILFSRWASVMRVLVLLNIHLLPWKVLHTLFVRELELHIMASKLGDVDNCIIQHLYSKFKSHTCHENDEISLKPLPLMTNYHQGWKSSL
jgi:hypothetical protein